MNINLIYNSSVEKYEKLNKLLSYPIAFNKVENCYSSYHNEFGVNAPFVKVFIIKGIGYQASVIYNNKNLVSEFLSKRYLFMRIGHSFNLYKIIPNYVGIKVLYKDRKVVVYGFNKNIVLNFAKILYNIKPPSVYTGRGIRIKKFNYKRKLGKKDIKKGKI